MSGSHPLVADLRQHRFNAVEELWLREAVTQPLDPRVAKVRLFGKIPKDFDPTRIDSRFYSQNQLTLLGLWYIDPGHVLFGKLDTVVRFIRTAIIEKPGIETFQAQDVAAATGFSVADVGRVFYELGQLGMFLSAASGLSNSREYSTMSLSGANSYDAYLNYSSMEALLQNIYDMWAPRAAQVPAHFTLDTDMARQAPTPALVGVAGGGRVFIGHGRSGLWRELVQFLREQLGLSCAEFNAVSAAGVATVERLRQMLDEVSFAFLVMTAEDEGPGGRRVARMNVIHEVGLLQGRLGFEKAIVLLEEGCEEFSNIHGLGHIHFPPGKIAAAFEDIRRVLQREGVIATE